MKYNEIVEVITRLSPEQLMALREYIDGILKINIVHGWRRKIKKEFVRRCLVEPITNFRVIDQIQNWDGVTYYIMGEASRRESERYTIYFDGFSVLTLAKRMQDMYEVYSNIVGKGKTIVVCTPTPEGTHYLRIENTTGYFKMVNGKLIVIDEVDYRLSGFESGW